MLRQRPASRDLIQQQQQQQQPPSSSTTRSRIHQFRQQQELQSSEDRDDEWTIASNHRPAMLQRQTSLVETDGDVSCSSSSILCSWHAARPMSFDRMFISTAACHSWHGTLLYFLLLASNI